MKSIVNGWSFDYSTYTIDKWHHIVTTINSSQTKKGYVNGSLKGQKTYSGPLLDKNQDLYIGSARRGWPYYSPFEHFEGEIDDVRIYNRALTDNEVNQLYERGRTN